ncbi:MAG TPA: hypothetical protein VG477_16700 [Thermoanaerobaculia bacterium]|nr:hypothetical protein [Thermoanaerobaculia bacterium]
MDLDLTGRQRDDPTTEYARRLRPLTRWCAEMLGLPFLFGALSWILVGEPGDAPMLPRAVRVSLAILAAILILLSSRFRSTTLRRAFPRSAELEASPDAVLAAYQRATKISFLILALASLLGLVVALGAGLAVYGMVLCAASAFAMLTRWPRAIEVDRLVRRRASP